MGAEDSGEEHHQVYPSNLQITLSASTPVDNPDVSIMITRPSPDNTVAPDELPATSEEPGETVVHVLVHRESEELQDL